MILRNFARSQACEGPLCDRQMVKLGLGICQSVHREIPSRWSTDEDDDEDDDDDTNEQLPAAWGTKRPSNMLSEDTVVPKAKKNTDDSVAAEMKLAKEAWQEAYQIKGVNVKLTLSVVDMLLTRTPHVRDELKTKMRSLTGSFSGFRASSCMEVIRKNRDLLPKICMIQLGVVSLVPLSATSQTHIDDKAFEDAIQG
ncbi:hypothetical protein BDR04DRAFT_1123845 [Suillus decipiens]|nr:hypothetical protein BDR04DRAFT_1123845 [Suillus decipiens]